jgi:hypothetical protein
MLPLSTAVFHPGKVAALFGVLASNVGGFLLSLKASGYDV